MAVGADGNTYVATAQRVDGGSLTALGPDGSVIYEIPFRASVVALAPGRNGILWVIAGGLFQVDAQGHATLINAPFFSSNTYYACSDVAGNLYVAAYNSGRNSISKVNPAGTVVGTFSLDSYGLPTAIAVDTSGAVYVIGKPADTFVATPGAFQAKFPNIASSLGKGYALKIAPELDRVVYATLLYQGQSYGLVSPTAIAVDKAGNAYIGGSLEQGPDQLLVASEIGLPLHPAKVAAYVLKLNAEGSSVIWCDALASGSVDSLAVLPDGQVHALVAMFPSTSTFTLGPNVERGESLFRIGSNGALEGNQFIGGAAEGIGLRAGPLLPDGYLAAVPGGDSPLRILVATNSARIPVVFNDEVTRPVLISFKPSVAEAELSISVELLKPFVTGNGTVDVLIKVSNKGPGAAEGVQLRAKVEDANGGSGQVTGCFPGGVAICNAGNGALIPLLPAGTSMEIEFVYGYGCPTTSTCAPQIFASVLAMTPDTNLRNNSLTFSVPATAGLKAEVDSLQPVLRRRLVYYRSDLAAFDGTSSIFSPPTTADPALTVWVPIQTAAGNVWHFDSWADGNRDNPRTFDASNGIPNTKGRINFRTERPVGADPGSLDLVALPGSNSLSQTLKLYPVDHAGKWIVGTPSAAWLSVAVGASNDPDGSVTVTGTADVTAIPPGFYTATFPVKLIAAGYPDITTDIPATLRVTDREPAIAAGGFVSAASYDSGPPASNEIITIFGSGLGPPELVHAFVPEAGSLPTSLAGTSVEFQGTPLQLLYVHDQSIAAILPSTVYDTPSQLKVKIGGITGPAASIPAPPYGPGVNGSSFAPALFALDGSGRGTAAAVNADGQINSVANPAKRGSVILVFGTGFPTAGLCSSRSFGARFPASTLVPGTPSPVEAFIGGKPAYVLYSGTGGTTTCGLQQFNILIPEDSATGPAVPLRLGIPYTNSSFFEPYMWFSTPSGTTLAIH